MSWSLSLRSTSYSEESTVYIRESYMYSSIVRLPDLHRTVRTTYTLENMDGAGISFSLVRLTLMSINGVMHALQPHCFRGERILIIFASLYGPTCEINCAKLSTCQHANSKKINSILTFCLSGLPSKRHRRIGNHLGIMLLRE